MDTLTSSERSLRMARVRSKDTKPEMLVRRLVHGLGYRYRLHDKRLPGTPDMVFTGRKKVIFVHGCFWHRHAECPLARLPKSRLDFWLPKLEGNRERDLRQLEALRAKGWEPMIIWECEVKDLDSLIQKLHGFLAEGNAE
ncbi:very short patch repair endonuclease [Pseudomonas typographi]|uniref:very short patch repair endonuclease n=1 Tax=Pseudomonas typographi TaxID=2715964 RepID=UPI0016892A6C|nr:DNA mismatch endonuclease Vsr [Pseudomonas typographi]MBD1552774.1 DNA mismatch endonuclease Vsr [Pseudomonas typographi]